MIEIFAGEIFIAEVFEFAPLQGLRRGVSKPSPVGN
jgi:hypothetical protein